MNAQLTPAPTNPELDAFWMPFTANRQFKANPRLLARAEGMYYWDKSGREVLDGVARWQRRCWRDRLAGGHGEARGRRAGQERGRRGVLGGGGCLPGRDGQGDGCRAVRRRGCRVLPARGGAGDSDRGACAAVHAVISIYRALLAGAPVAQIAEVTGLSPDQVAARWAEWAGGQIRLREWAGTGMTREEYGRAAAAAAGADGRPGVVSFGFRRLCRRARASRFTPSLIAPRLREE